MIKRAFTLIELLVVIGISAILLTLVAIPLIQGFNLTRAAQGFAAAQDRARVLIDQITREISNSSGVRDNTGNAGSQWIVVPGQNGAPVEVLLELCKLDIVKPYQGEPIRGPSGALINPITGKEDPTLTTPKGQISLPVAPGASIIRYFIGLKQPLAGDLATYYNNPYEGVLMRRNGQADNLYVLYRAEVVPRIFNSATNRFVTNTALFENDPNSNLPIYDDPYFFTLRPGVDFDINTRALTAAGTAKAGRIRNWQRFSTIVTESSRYDMIQAVFDKSSRLPVYDNNVPRVLGLVQFAPSRVSSEPATGQVAVRSGEESVNSAKVGPDVYRTEYGGWTSLFVRLWPSVFDFNGSWNVFSPWQSGTPYTLGRSRPTAGTSAAFSLYEFDGTGNELTDGTEVFDVTAYINARDHDPNLPPPTGGNLYRYPFSYALDQANSRSGWYSGGNPNLRANFIPFIPNPRRGEIVASFPITDVGDGAPLPPTGSDNRPSSLTGVGLIPNNDNTLVGTPSATRWQNAAYSPSSASSQINQRFNVLWNDWDFIWGAAATNLERAKYCKRFIDLRFLPCYDGAASPLHPTLGFARARIVPGSEIIMGPDQMPGANYGRYVRYTRVTLPPAGPNQYYINYVNQREVDYAALGLTPPANVYDPRVYDATNPLQAILQPQFRAGYVEFNSRFGEPLPDVDRSNNATGSVLVFYRFQFTEPNDVMGADYDSRQVMSINLTIRNFPQTTLPNTQSVTLKGSATVRNFIR